MVEVARKKYPLNPTLKLVNSEGRATDQFFRILTAIGDLIETISIQDGEITTEKLADLAVQASKLDDGAVVIGKLAAGSIYVATLFADEVVITGKIAQNAVSEATAGVQVGIAGPNGDTLVDLDVPVTTSNNTGVILTFTGFMSLPTPDPGNFGTWQIAIKRNGVQISISPALYYDDNFAYPITAAFIDPTPGINPNYQVTSVLNSGLGNFQIIGGKLSSSLLKR